MKYDKFQTQAIEHINAGHSVIVSAPTGSGKTAIAEHVINESLANGTRVIYTAPIKALSNQKFRDFQTLYEDKIGILTGDVSINPHAPILIMTTEIFRNKILSEESDLDEYEWIIFDEIHYIDDYERGTVWEESLIFLPKHMKMLALSATIPNINEFADWIQAVHGKPVKVVVETTRPVPLHIIYQCENKFFDNINKIKGAIPPISSRKLYYSRGKSFIRKEHLRANRLDTLINHLQNTGKLPCIYFVFGRRRAEYLAEELLNYDFLDTHEKAEITALYSRLCDVFDLKNEESANILLPLVERGIAYHHAGMLPTLKEVIERLFTSKLIKVIFTTETFALGINMPAKTVAFDDLRKYYGSFHANLKTRDFYQMAGRAGRRGIDEEGFVFARVNLNSINYDELRKIIQSSPEEVRSRFNASYATILNLYARYGEKLYDIYPRSFYYFQTKKKTPGRALNNMQAKVQLLKNLQYISNGQLTAKGEFAGKLYGYEISLTELYEQGILEELSEISLGVLAVAVVFEPRKNTTLPKLNKETRKLNYRTDNMMKIANGIEKKYGILPISKGLHYHLAPCVEAWMRGVEFNSLLSLTDADEGEIIRYLRMGIQVLREILDTPASNNLKNKIRSAIKLMNRDIIDAENQLRKIE
ncbi:MAG: DEAD/DEAH box helicase [Candidatus Omnitrophica bacterium]|nr:DEAD/DEAH box helicase [Candidatus Omnitrophota bacterium]